MFGYGHVTPDRSLFAVNVALKSFYGFILAFVGNYITYRYIMWCACASRLWQIYNSTDVNSIQ